MGTADGTFYGLPPKLASFLIVTGILAISLMILHKEWDKKLMDKIFGE